VEEAGAGRRRDAFRVGAHRVDPMANEIDGVHVDSKAMDVLVCLASAAPAVVANATLFERVWPGVIVGDNALHQTILHLRKAFGDDARTPRFIENIPRRGYRLLAPVDWLVPGALGGSSNTEVAESPVIPTRLGPGHRRWVGIGVVVAIAFGISFAIYQVTREGGTRAETVRGVDTRSPAKVGVSKPRLVVLPFENLSSLEDADLAAGLTLDIGSQLSKISALTVMSYLAVQHELDNGIHPSAVGARLGADRVVRGSVRASGERLRVTVQISDVTSHEQTWSETYDGVLGDVFAMQSEVAGG
jgi:TolB-like protein/DNA-binding winged helix-turn-helix (wHTH) protein